MHFLLKVSSQVRKLVQASINRRPPPGVEALLTSHQEAESKGGTDLEAETVTTVDLKDEDQQNRLAQKNVSPQPART
jgi:hypothetical protein